MVAADGIGAAPSAAPGGGEGPAAVRIAYSLQADGTEDCAKFFGGKSYVGIEECLAKETVVQSGVEFRIFGPDPDDRRLRPDANAPDPPPSWESKHYQWTAQAVRDAIVTYQPHGFVPNGYIVLSQLQTSDEGARGFQAPPPSGTPGGTDLPCYITILPAASDQKELDFRHTVAHEIAHCFQVANVEASGYPRTKWIVESMAEYFANLVYPQNNKEQRERHPKYLRRELKTTIFARSYDNASWVQHYANERGGPPAVIELLRAVNNADQAAKDGGLSYMHASPQYAGLHHSFVQRITDGSLRDSGPGTWPNSRKVSKKMVVLDSTALAFHVREVEPYDIDRILIEIPAGKKLTLLIRSDTAHQISYGQASGGNIEGWMPAGQSIGFDVDCETLQRFYFIASTAAAARKSLVYDALVEDSDECAEQVPEVIDSIDSCLIGTWKLNMDAHLGDKDHRPDRSGANVRYRRLVSPGVPARQNSRGFDHGVRGDP